MTEDAIQRYAIRVGYTEKDLEKFKDGGHRTRQVTKLSEAAAQYSIQATVIDARHCNTGHKPGQTFILDVDGNFITKRCPNKMCAYLISQMIIPIALINERLSEGLDPNPFHFMRVVHCLDAGVDCQGYGQVTIEIKVIPRVA